VLAEWAKEEPEESQPMHLLPHSRPQDNPVCPAVPGGGDLLLR
jgi:hypothetical protein